jgi:hypothetical protein
MNIDSDYRVALSKKIQESRNTIVQLLKVINNRDNGLNFTQRASLRTNINTIVRRLDKMEEVLTNGK